MANTKTKHHLEWIYNRMINHHNENPNSDYMLKFKEILDNDFFLNLDKEIKSEIFLSLSIRIGYIETGTIHRAKDLENIGELKPKALTTEQMKTIINLEAVMEKLMQ